MSKYFATAVAAVLALTAFNSYAENPEYGSSSTNVSHPEWAKNAVIYEVNLRQGTPERTFKGFEKQLPRLRDLGVDILWLMPIHPISEVNRKGELGSYYAVADYKAVNPEFGTMQDFKDLVNTAHELGMKVIIDEVCNHSGCDNPWVKDHPDYYARNAEGKMFGPFDWTDTYKLDYSNPAMRAAMMDALRFWVKEADIDGYRFDVAMEVPTDFWNQLRPELEKLKPGNIFMLAEASKPELTVSAFDADYNWPMKDVFNAIAHTQGVNRYAREKGHALKIATPATIDSLLAVQSRQYPQGAINMLMITNHDLNSWEGTEFDRLGPAVGAFAVLSYTLPGIPMLYTGQEVGFNHPFEFFKRDEVIPDYTENDFTVFYNILNTLRHNNPALESGAYAAPVVRYPTTDPNVYVFSRQKGDHRVLVAVNLSNSKARVEFTGKAPDQTGLHDLFAGLNSGLPQVLAPWQFTVLAR